MKKNNIITVVNDRGESIPCRVLFTVENDKNGKNYIVYTDDSTMDNGDVRTYASIYTKSDDDTLQLHPVKDKSEWDFIEKVLNSLQKGMEKEDEGK